MREVIGIVNRKMITLLIVIVSVVYFCFVETTHLLFALFSLQFSQDAFNKFSIHLVQTSVWFDDEEWTLNQMKIEIFFVIVSKIQFDKSFWPFHMYFLMDTYDWKKPRVRLYTRTASLKALFIINEYYTDFFTALNIRITNY